MEGIVVGFAQINFDKNFTNVNNVDTCVNQNTSNMSVCESDILSSESGACVSDQETKISLNSLHVSDNDCDEIGDYLGNEKHRGYTLAERRQMPKRSAKESSLSGVKYRTKMKPAKRVKIQEDFKNLKPSQIKKIYLNKKLTNFKPSSLETILEEAPTSHNTEENLCHFMAGRKIKRTLSFQDGFKCNKTLLNKRRAKIKKTFGKRFALKKISFEEFMTKLNNNVDTNESDCCMDDQKSVSQSENRSNTPDIITK